MVISLIRYDEIRRNKSLGLIMSEHLDIPKYYTFFVSGGCLNLVFLVRDGPPKTPTVYADIFFLLHQTILITRGSISPVSAG